ncbi:MULTISPECIES: DUF1707 SHOCT-like domain-containing protein [Saccharothrix]|uniref:DUF1707 SHOCT-like domain-containing protein n=1 Tax=Saccharothrix TaxID=2071 RepID=UPI000968E6DC|nr:DUF1707 domain-containing protein [Saccharothrix sp. CB00851]OKI38727.1 hypothetical protein A6A25_00445 [Saccharothrix sp. CB00851]
MSERDIRIGDAEREHALGLLGTHLGEGRLSVDEYGDRSARVATAKTRGDLYALFSDLPAPRPTFPRVEPPVPDRARRGAPVEFRVSTAAVTAVAIISVVLFVLLRNPFVFLLIPAVMLLIGRMGRR